MPILRSQLCKNQFAALLWLGFAQVAFSQVTPADRAGQLLQQLQNDPALKPGTQLTLPKIEPKAAQPGLLVEAQPGETTFVFKSVLVEGNTLVETYAIEDLLSPWLNKPLTLPQLEQVVSQISALYRAQGWLAQALLPDQDVSEGRVRISIIEGKLGRVLVNMQLDQSQLGEVLSRRIDGLVKNRMQLGQPITFDNMDWALLVAGDLPGVSVAGSLQAGELPGTSDLVVKVESKSLLVGQVSTDNQGSRSTGIIRLNGQLQINSPFGMGEQFSFAGSKNSGSTYVRAAFTTPVGIEEWRGLMFNAEVSRMDYRTLDQFKPDGAQLRPEGSSDVYGLHLISPLVRSASTNLNLDWGQEFRSSVDKSDLEVPGTLSVVRRTQVHSRTLGLNLSHLDDLFGGGNNMISFVQARGWIDLGPSGAASLDETEARTKGLFEKEKLTFSRLQFMDGKYSLFMTASKQWANKNLDASEKLYLGGASGVRAFPNSEAGGSTGVTATVELRRDWSSQWQTALFYDYGRIFQFRVPTRADGTSLLNDQSNKLLLHGRGLSVTYRHDSGVELKTTVSRRISRNPQPTSAGTDNDGTLRLNRVWFSISMPF